LQANQLKNLQLILLFLLLSLTFFGADSFSVDRVFLFLRKIIRSDNDIPKNENTSLMDIGE